MKIVVLTQYFPPETGAPQNRLFATASALQRRGADVTVLTAMPNYPDMLIHEPYRGAFYRRERMDGMDVHRAWIYVSRSRGIIARLCNYFSFVFTALVVGLFKLERSDILLVESPPLFLGITAMWLARAKGAKLVFNVSDLWPESAVQLGLVTNPTLIKWSTWLEMRCYHRAALITGQTQGIVKDIQARCPDKNVLWVPNGVDLASITSAEAMAPSDIRSRLGITASDLVIAYAGIIGHAQGLEVVPRAGALLRARKDVHFMIIGDGPEKEKLIELKRALGPINVHFVDRMPRKELLSTLRAADAVVVPLRRNDLFKGAIPSKIFEALALRKPLLLGVEGEARELFIDQGGAGLAFVPEDPRSLADVAMRYADDRSMLAAHGEQGSVYASTLFDREVISERLMIALKALPGRSGESGDQHASSTSLSQLHRQGTASGQATVSIVIPCLNEERFIGRCLRSLVDSEREGIALQVFVCDGMSDDGTRAIVSGYEREHGFIHLVDNPHRVTPHALNLGLRSAPFEFGMILGAHAEVAPDYVRTCVRALQDDPTLGCAGGLLVNEYGDPTARCIGTAMGHAFGVGGAKFRTGGKEGYVDTVAFGVYRREVFERVGWFDEDLVRNQDDEFSYRLLKADYRIKLIPRAKATYHVRASFAKLWKQYIQYGYWKVYVNRKHRAVTTIRQVVPALWVIYLVGGAVAALLIHTIGPLFLVGVGCYLLTSGLAALFAARSLRDVPGVIYAFWTLHAAYGIGYLQGVLRFLVLRQRPSETSKRSTR